VFQAFLEHPNIHRSTFSGRLGEFTWLDSRRRTTAGGRSFPTNGERFSLVDLLPSEPDEFLGAITGRCWEFTRERGLSLLRDRHQLLARGQGCSGFGDKTLHLPNNRRTLDV
jgi:hypothetical protein